jgi:hypothetical protein
MWLLLVLSYVGLKVFQSTAHIVDNVIEVTVKLPPREVIGSRSDEDNDVSEALELGRVSWGKRIAMVPPKVGR